MPSAMDVTSAPQLSAMAAKGDAVNLTLLRKALNNDASTMGQLLQGLPQPPQKEGAGTVLDVQA